jgi:hypothetical protein
MSLDTKTGLPVKDFKRGDFELLDNNRPVAIETFDSGAQFDTRPVVLWMVVICNERSILAPNPAIRSASFMGHEYAFKPALDLLDKNDHIGIAHWCDNGEAQIDLIPTSNRDEPISTLARTLLPMSFNETSLTQARHGELACQRMIHMILQNADDSNPQPLPVIVFLHSDWTGMPKDELNNLVNDVLETSGVVFGIKDQRVPDMGPLQVEQGEVFHYLASETGGQYLAATPKRYSAALEEILLQLHFRYQLGFQPPALDRTRHTLTVRLTKQARQRYQSVRVRSRPEYIPSP